MKADLSPAIAFLQRRHPLARFSLLLAACLLPWSFVSLLTLVFPSLQPGSGPDTYLSNLGQQSSLTLAVFAVPALETALFQALPLHVLSKVRGVGQAWAIWVSATLFATTHLYSIGYALATFLIGLVLAVGYAAQMRPGGLPFYLIYSVHASSNLLTWLASRFLEA